MDLGYERRPPLGDRSNETCLRTSSGSRESRGMDRQSDYSCRYFGAGGHLFMRDPSSYLLGIHAQYIDLSGDDIFRIGPEAELYLGDITLSAMAGFEDADSFNSDDVVAQVEAAYYINDNFKIYGGYRHFLPIDAGAIGFEFQPESLPGTLFVDAMVGSDDYVSVMGGFRLYFGADDKSLKARQREDDPGHFFNLLARAGFHVTGYGEKTWHVADEWCDSVYLRLDKPDAG